jgi:hypothetical protein
MSSFEVGQILFLLPKKENKIVPVRVVEVIVRKKLNDQTVEYMVEIPSRTRDVVALSELDTVSFTSDRELRDYMVTNSINVIDQMVATARRHALSAFGEASVPPEASREPEVDAVYSVIELPDGTKARIRNESSIS